MPDFRVSVRFSLLGVADYLFASCRLLSFALSILFALYCSFNIDC